MAVEGGPHATEATTLRKRTNAATVAIIVLDGDGDGDQRTGVSVSSILGGPGHGLSGLLRAMADELDLNPLAVERRPD